jgi:DNA gyrase subunit A
LFLTIPILGISGIWFSLILFVSENGYGKRIDVDQYRLQSRGGKGVINMKATPKAGKDSALASSTRPAGSWPSASSARIIHIETKSIRAAGRSTQGVKLLDLEPQDKVTAAVIPPEESKTAPENGTLLQ